MPEPRETHAAIDARRNAQRSGGGDAHELALLLAQHQRLDAPGGKCSCGHETALGDLTSRHVADAVFAAGWRPVGTIYRTARDRQVEAEQSADHFRILATRLRAERDALAATVQRVQGLASEWQAYIEDVSDSASMDVDDALKELRAALAAPSDPATDTGGEGHG